MKLKRWKIITAASLAVVLLLTVAISVYAYFSTRVYVYTEDGKEILHVGMNLQLLFDKLEGDTAKGEGNYVPADTVIDIPWYETVLNAEGNPTGEYIYHESATYNKDAPWGTPQNPYVISDIKHLQNLSALQNVGYFELMYVGDDFNGTSPNFSYNNGVAMPYFVVSTKLGTPVVINAVGSPEFRPIGSSTHPFIGVIGGAFVDGVATLPNGNTSTNSVIHGAQVYTTTKAVDVGLFGYIGYLGTEPTDEQIEAGSDGFDGAASVIQDLLISDVQIRVSKPSVTEIISDYFASILGANHNYTYTALPEDNQAQVFHETHHIGIFAGHVSYASLKNISVYYSNEELYAIDLVAADTAADNYHTSTGIVGFMYNMGAEIENVSGLHCQVKLGGTSSDGASVPSSGTGTGGGALSGSGRGYVTAAEIFTEYNQLETQTTTGNEVLWDYKIPGAATWSTGAILIIKKADNSYTLADGFTPVTVSGGTATANGNSYGHYIVLTGAGTAESPYVYYASNETTRIDDYKMTGSRINGQVIWQFSIGGKAGDGIWHYGVRIFETENADGTYSYTLEDGTAVTVDSNKIATASDGKTWEGYLLRTGSGTETDPYIYYDSTKTHVVTSYNRKPLTLLEAKNSKNESLCTEWIRNRLLWGTEATGMYYFYDGVFTFALSSKDDTIRDTWANDTAPTIYLGKDDSAEWETDYAMGNQAVISLLRPVTDNATLDQAISEGKQIYISARPTSSSDAFLMSLINSTGSSRTISGVMKNLDDKIGEQVRESYASGQFTMLPQTPLTGKADKDMFYKDANGNEVTYTISELLAQWDDFEKLYIGRTSTTESISELKNKYNISPSKTSTFYYFRADTGAAVSPSGGSVSLYNMWDGYFFYSYEQGSWSWGEWGYLYTVTFYYQPPNNANPIPLGQDQYYADDFDKNDVALNEFLTRVTVEDGNGNSTPASKNDEAIYRAYTVDGVTTAVTGAKVYNLTSNAWEGAAGIPVINLVDNTFHTSGATVIQNGSIVSKDTNTDISYYYKNVVNGKYYNSSDVEVQKTTVDTAVANNTHVLLNRYPSYTFSDNSQTSSLQFLNEYTGTWWLFGTWPYGSKYSIWAGTDAERTAMLKNTSLSTEEKTMFIGTNKQGVLVFEDGKDYCYIRYASGNTAQYVNYSYSSQTSNGSFGGTNAFAADAPIKLYVYVIEGIVDMNWGVNTFKPKGTEGTDYHALSAGEYVLWPQHTLMQDGTYNRYITVEEGSTQRTVVSNRLNTTQNASMLVTNDPTYKVVSLAELNWTNENGVALGSIAGFGLTQKFQMADQAGFGTMVNLLNGSVEWPIGGKKTQLVAPIGSEGVEANIPKGCVAFRVNELDPTAPNTVRIIVAIPTTNLYVGEGGFDLDLLNDYYIGLWNVEASGESTTQSFSKADAVEKFELPRSYVYEMGITAKDADDAVPAGAIYKNYITTEYGGSQYRTYLNGGCVLVAYEFIVDAVGVYVIGSAHGDDTTETQNFPMEIVHFSVSGTASAGRDGVGGSKTGSIDFVYDYSGKVMTVGTWGNDKDGGVEDYAQNYYVSQCILFTENNQKVDSTTFANLNKFKFKVRRYIDPTSGKSTIKLIVTADTGDIYNQNSMQISRYSVFADDTIRDPAVVATGAE